MSSIPFDLTKIKAFVLDMDGVISATVSPIGPDGMPMHLRQGGSARGALP